MPEALCRSSGKQDVEQPDKQDCQESLQWEPVQEWEDTFFITQKELAEDRA